MDEEENRPLQDQVDVLSCRSRRGEDRGQTGLVDHDVAWRVQSHIRACPCPSDLSVVVVVVAVYHEVPVSVVKTISSISHC